MYLSLLGILRRIIHLFFPTTKFNEECDKTHDIAIIGAGLSGIATAVNLQKRGFNNFKIFEKNPEVGGTWYENTYPGCGCDVASHFYSFSFARNCNWSKRFSSREEIWKYIKSVVTKYDLYSKIKFNTEVKSCIWKEDTKTWEIVTGGTRQFDVGNQQSQQFSVVINASGAFTIPKIPNFKGKENFKGPSFHTARWDDKIDLKGKRVGVIGTGASAVQLIPAISDEVVKNGGHLYVFQRSAAWVPARSNKLYSEFQKKIFSFEIFGMQIFGYLTRLSWCLSTEINYLLFVVESWLTKVFKYFLVSEMKGRIEFRGETLNELIPDYPVSCKRITPHDDYLETFLKGHVSLVTEIIFDFSNWSFIFSYY